VHLCVQGPSRTMSDRRVSIARAARTGAAMFIAEATSLSYGDGMGPCSMSITAEFRSSDARGVAPPSG
jgi:hypothetical protein